MKRLLTAGIALAVIVVGFSVPQYASAATISLSGQAWSDQYGWVSFKGSGYGVLVDTATGAMSGAAWSETLGWLSFDDSTCGSSANVDIQSGEVTGWAKFVGLDDDGCVHISPDSGSAYGVTYDNQDDEFSGTSWNNYAGWIKWQGSTYGVVSDGPIGNPPEAPTSLTTAAVSTSRIDLAWSDNSQGENGFKIERKTGAGGTWSEIHVTNPNVESYQNTGLSAGTLYYYRVRASNSSGDSNYSNESSTSTLALSSTITVNATPDGASWTINPGNIQRTGDATVTVNPSSSGTSYTLTGGTLSGYDAPTCTWDNGPGSGSGCSMTLFGGETADFTLNYERAFNYTLSAEPDEDGVVLGQVDEYASFTITRELAAGSGPAQDVELSLSGVPSGVEASFAPSSGIISSDEDEASIVLNFTVNPGSPFGSHDITITGDPLDREVVITLEIEESPDVFAVCEHDPASAQVNQPVEWSVNPSGGVPPYTYQWQGENVPASPAPTTPEISVTYTTTGAKSARATVFDSNNVSAICPVNSINIGVDPIFEEF